MTVAAMTTGGGLPHPRRAIAIFAVLSAMAMVVVDANIANVALPTLAKALHASPARSILVITAYQAALVMALLPLGALGERLGFRPVFGTGVALFTLASMGCALAPSLSWLLTFRFLQGLGGAAVMALGVALLRFTVTESRLGAAIGWNALTVALSAAAGPALGGLILAAADWRFIFAVNLPIGIAALLAAQSLPAAGGQGVKLDLRSAALNAALFGALIGGLETVTHSPFLGVALLAVAGVAAVALAHREFPKSRPMIPLDLLRMKSFRMSVIASVLCFAGQTAALTALPFLLQDALSFSPARAGAIMMIWPLSVAATAPIAGRLSDRFPTGRLAASGASLLAAGIALLETVPNTAGLPGLIPALILAGAGFGLFQTANNRNMFGSAPADRSGAAGGMQGTARLTGQTLGAVLLTLLFSIASTRAVPIGLSVAAGLVSASAAVSALRDRRWRKA